MKGSKWLTCVFCVLGWIIMTALGAGLVAGFFFPDLFYAATQWLGKYPVNLVSPFVGVGLIVISVVWLLRGVFGVIRTNHIAFETNRGRILVTLSALQESLERALAEDDNVHDSRVTILNAGEPSKPLRILSQVVIYERADIISLQKYLQELLEERFKEMMAVDRPVRYDVELVRIRAKGRKKAQGEEKEEGSVFQGPRYPVDSE